MPSAKAKRQPVEAGPQSPSGSRTEQPGGHLLKQSGKKSRKSKAKKKAKKKKKMNLPTRLSRLLNYGTRRVQTDSLKSQPVKLEQVLHGQSTGTTYCQGSGVFAALTKARTSDSLGGNDGCLSSSSHRTFNSSHQKTFECGIASYSENGTKVRDSNSKNGSGSGGEHRLIAKEKLIALDCEMVGVGPQGRISALARCSIVDYDCNVVYDAYVKPELEILHYRTPWSGIRKHHMEDAVPFREAQEQIANILRGKILVGHSLRFDMQVLKLSHPSNDIRDISMYKGLRDLAGMAVGPGQHPGLKKLTKRLFGHSIQTGEHCSVEDAKATMNLYKLVEGQWEQERVSVFPDRDYRISFMDDHFWPDDLAQ